MSETTLLHVALQDCFFNDTVTISVDGKELARKSDLTTKTQIGLASIVDLQVQPGTRSPQVCVAVRPQSTTLTIDVSRPVYVGVSVGADGQVVYTRSEGPFRYA